MNRQYPTQPLVGVGALVKKDNAVLLVKRKNDPGSGLWAIPGGLLELGETLEEAAVREVMEETNLRIGIDALVDVVQMIQRDDNGLVSYHYVIVDFRGHIEGGNLKPSEEILDAAWVDVNELSKLAVTPSTGKFLRKLGFLKG
ncbi:MAG: NUDIX hydrolase [Candidatus Bathyarchaeia archaeon]